jgi:hypothetical protein
MEISLNLAPGKVLSREWIYLISTSSLAVLLTMDWSKEMKFTLDCMKLCRRNNLYPNGGISDELDVECEYRVCYQQLFSEDLGPYAPNGRSQAEHVDGWGRIALREGESPILPGEEREEEGQGLLVGHFYTTLNLKVRRQYVITWLLSPVG